MFVYCWSKQLTSIKFCDNELDIGKTFVIDWNNYLREVVFGGVCRETRECFLVAVPDRTAQTLLAVIRQHIHPNTTILSDEWRAYQ